MTRLLTIGEFAARCGLSRSALRFYDQNDLVRPHLVDGETGYRYYATSQLERAALVRRLRAAEMPIGALRRYLAAPAEQRQAILEAHVASVRARAAAIETAVDELSRGLDAAAPRGDSRICAVEPTRFAEALQQVGFAIADPGVRADLGAVWVEAKEESLRLVATDSYRLAVRDLVPESIGPGGLRGVIEAAHATTLAVELAAAGTLLLSQDADGVISATVDGRRTPVGDAGEGFPDYERILTDLPSGHQIALARDAVIAALADLPADIPHLRLSFQPRQLVLQAGDERTTIVTGEWSGPPVSLHVDSRFFTEAVNATVGPDLVIEAYDPLQPITLRSADTGTFSVLTMPIRPPHAG